MIMGVIKIKNKVIDLKNNNRNGEINLNFQGLKMTIIEYRKVEDIDVQFEDGYIAKNRMYKDFKKGSIKNLYKVEVCGIGFIGKGKYTSNKNKLHKKLYATWNNMLKRCYDEKYQEKHPTYKGCKVCEEWHNYQNFAKWCEDNIWNDDCTNLDKDILVKGNKKYSPNACVFVDNRINKLFIKSNKTRGIYPIGTHYDKSSKKFKAQYNIMIDGKNQRKHLGLFKTAFEAFDVYKNFKEKQIKQVADEYKSKYSNFPQKLYDAMYNYRVEIDD